MAAKKKKGVRARQVRSTEPQDERRKPESRRPKVPAAPATRPDPSSARELNAPAPARPRGVVERTRLRPVDLRFSCPPVSHGSRQPSLSTLLWQDRPVQAIRTGLTLYATGYNIFVSGTVGSGRTRLVTDLIRKLKPPGRRVPDRVFVSNFREPNRPRLITLDRGAGPRFRDEMRELVVAIQEALQGALRSRTHRVSHDLVLRATEEREKRLMAALERQARREGCAVVQFPGAGGGTMADIYPEVDGEPINPEALRDLVGQGRLSHARYRSLLGKRDALMGRLEDVTERLLRLARETDQELRRMDQQVAGHVLRSHLRAFARRWPSEQIGGFLADLREHVLEDVDRWLAAEPPPPGGAPAGTAPAEAEPLPPPPAPVRGEPVRFNGVEVHVVKTSADDQCPVVLETHPTYANLFGMVEPGRDGHGPSLAHVHPGSLLRADGGFLILRLSEVLGEPGVWTQLKRALRVGCVEIREFDPNSGVAAGTLQPEAVPISLKVIMIGEPGAHETLAHEDSQFLQTFKVHAEFDSVMPATQGNRRRYADLIDWFRRQEGLLPFSGDACAAVVEFGARLAGRKDRLTARFGELADLVREASHLCATAGGPTVTREHIEAAQRARVFRVDLPREAIERDFRDGYLLLQTSGRAVGQVNALTVLETDAIMFGKPSRVTVATGAGPRERTGVINIERESDLSGPLHDKGVMILQGYLLQQFANDGPLGLQATICFEQTYGGIDGDSASGAELCALLSSLTGIPLAQGFGITGAINQRGEVQAVSGVNEKIEGFFRLCRSRGLSGDQGVILPRANVSDLMLDPEVVAAVEAGRFAIHAVESVEQMLELLTGRPAAEVKAAVAARLRAFRSVATGD
ncbi:MAG: Lon protease family protein [Planctomycetes bacterium]|nr:Lon protease family protein [Planctomycetota bacterium]MCB9888513.1 Lon protease family protein [Planctomycetota bacterium]